MTLALLPDVGGLGILLLILLRLWYLHPRRRVGWWLVGLAFILVEAVAWSFYATAGAWRPFLHVVALDSYVLAGATFLWSAADRPLRMRRTRWYALANVLPWIALATAYGSNMHRRSVFCTIAAIGFSVGVLSSFRKPRWGALIAAQAIGWLPLAMFLYESQYRDAVYWGLGWGYAWIAVVFWRTLPRTSTGRFAIVGGFFCWAGCFLVHPWVATSATYSGLAAEVWSMQKFLVTVGMLLVLLEEQIRVSQKLAMHDQLTKLPNRRLFEDRLAHDVRRAQRTGGRVALIALDLNGFKGVNDSLGHDAGDQVLCSTGRNLRAVVRRSDTLARVGGDEFMVIANDLRGPEDLATLLATLTRAVSQPMTINGHTVQVQASAGIALYPDEAEHTHALRDLADKRMYLSKRGGAGTDVERPLVELVGARE